VIASVQLSVLKWSDYAGQFLPKHILTAPEKTANLTWPNSVLSELKLFTL